MDNNLHLAVLQPNARPDHDPTQVRLRWWDDASYARYQAGDDANE